MRSRSSRLLVLWFVFSWLSVAPCLHAQQTRESEAPPSNTTDSYLNTIGGLSDLLNDMLTAARNGDRTALKSRIEDARIPNYQRWFARVYGENAGHSLADSYGEWCERREGVFIELFLRLAHQEGTIVVRHIKFDELHPGPQVLFDAYLADWEKPGATSPDTAGEIGYYFIFVDGRFRWDCISQRHSDLIGMPRCLNMPSPPYPREANGAQGVVVINVLVEKDGSVKVLNTAKGDPILAQAAVEAVRQWRCEPALFEGWRPTERQLTIEVTFKLSSPLQ